MAFKTSEELAALCRQLRERSGMTQTDWGASLDPPLSRQAITMAEIDPRSQKDGIRLQILRQKGGYEITAGYDLKKSKGE